MFFKDLNLRYSLFLRINTVPFVYVSTFIKDQLITKTYLYNFDPLKPHLNIVKLGFRGVNIIFLICAKKHRLWVLVRTARRGGSNEYPQSMFWAEIWKISEFLYKNFQFLEMKFSIFLNRRVFVMFNSTFVLLLLYMPLCLYHSLSVWFSITRTSLFKYTENFTTKKMKVFRWKILKFFIFLLKT